MRWYEKPYFYCFQKIHFSALNTDFKTQKKASYRIVRLGLERRKNERKMERERGIKQKKN